MVEDSKIMAALPFSGLPLDSEVRSVTYMCSMLFRWLLHTEC